VRCACRIAPPSAQAAQRSPARRVPGCWGAVDCGRRGTAGGVSGRLPRVGFRGEGCSRSPHRARLLPVSCWPTRRACPRPTVVVRGKAISWTRWPEHRRRNQRVKAHAVLAVVIGPLRVRLTGRNISVDPLATHLIINRRFPHGRHRRGSSAGSASTWCVHTVDGYGDKDSASVVTARAPRAIGALRVVLQSCVGYHCDDGQRTRSRRRSVHPPAGVCP
jgi:hypothetical protein